MITTLLGSLIGFGGSAIPSIIDIFKQKSDNKQELAKIKLQAELRAQGMDFDLQMYEKQGADKEHERLIAHDIAITKSGGFIGGLQRSVRPVITYAFFGLFATIQIVMLMEAIKTGQPFDQAIQLLWTNETQGIFASIIAFWFGSRALEKNRKK